MKNFRIILASNSPRRKELLAGLDIPFEVKVIQGIDESFPESLPAYDTAQYIAVKKAQAYRPLLDSVISHQETSITRKERVSFWENRRMLRMRTECWKC